MCKILLVLFFKYIKLDAKPKVSLLGLDRLAAAKKKEKLESATSDSNEPSSKRSKVYSFQTGMEEDADYQPSPRDAARKSDDRDQRERYFYIFKNY